MTKARTPLVVGVDPGKTTGLCFVNPDLITAGTIPIAWHKQFGLQTDAYDELMHWCTEALEDYQPVIFAVERFHLTPMSWQRSDSHYPIEAIGVVRLVAERFPNIVTMVQQEVSDAKAFATNDRLKALGMYARGLPHATDAARHAYLWMVRNGHLKPDESV